MNKRIVLCADDYGQSSPISQGIIKLVERGRLSAVSCLVTFPNWREQGKWLIPHQSRIDIGLHLNLTEGRAVSREYIRRYGPTYFALPTLLRLSFFQQLDLNIIAAELRAQVQYFVDVMGFFPRCVDGHQHVHQFPLIRHAFLSMYQQELTQQLTYVRLVNEKIHWHHCWQEGKKMVIILTGTSPFRKLLKRHGLPHNDSFAGIYAFNKSAHYREYFQGFLRRIKHEGLIMCHPGFASATEPDLIKNRQHEYDYLQSDLFLQDCLTACVTIDKFPSP